MTRDERHIRLNTGFLKIERTKEIDKKELREAYKEIWELLIELKMIGFKLWKKSTEENLSSFKDLLNKTFNKVYQIQPIINQKHFHEIENILNTFYSYWGGKTNLKDNLLKTEQIKLNQEFKAKYETLLDNLSKKIHKLIS